MLRVGEDIDHKLDCMLIAGAAEPQSDISIPRESSHIITSTIDRNRSLPSVS